jgi:organic radical activating enzyme
VIEKFGYEENDILFSWEIIGKCNFNCAYCYNKDFNKTNQIANIKPVLARLKTMSVPFTIEILGGEPTLHKEILNVLETLNKMEMCTQIFLISNMTAPVELYNNASLLEKVQLGFSYHTEFKGDFLEKYKHIKTSNKHISLVIPLTEKELNFNLKYFKSVQDDLYYNKLASTPTYTANYEHTFDNLVNEQKYPCVIDGKETELSVSETYKLNDGNFKDYNCIAKSYTIEVNGKIRSDCESGSLPFSLRTVDFEKSVVCKHTECICTDTFKYLKYK